MNWFFHPTIHNVVTVLHVTCAMFWLAWMVFFSVIMMPVLRRKVPEDFTELRAILQYRTRQPLRYMILLLVLTGLYNMAYRGLFNVRTLLYTEYGLTVVLKLFLAMLLIGLYFLAPDFTRLERSPDPSKHQRQQTVSLYVHGTILTLGLFVAYLGISLGG